MPTGPLCPFRKKVNRMSKYTRKIRPGFMIYHEDLSLMANLNAEEFKQILLALLAYSRSLVEAAPCELPEMSGWCASIMNIMKDKLDRDHQEYTEKCSRNASIRRRGMKGDERPPQSTNSNSNRNCNSNSNVTATAAGESIPAQALAPLPQAAQEASPEAPQVNPPSLKDVTQFCQDNALKVDPLRFVSFYGAKGWLIGSQPMRDWRSALLTWDSRERAGEQSPAPPVKQVTQQQYTQRPYTNSEESLDRMMAEFLAGRDSAP